MATLSNQQVEWAGGKKRGAIRLVIGRFAYPVPLYAGWTKTPEDWRSSDKLRLQVQV